MIWLSNLIAGFKSLFGKARFQQELDEELDSYLEASAHHKRLAGMSLNDARGAAIREMGSRSAVKHSIWSSRWESALDGFFQDLRVSIRMLARSPGFTAVALMSLALGIGANTAMFTLINQVLLRNLPVRNPQQLVSFGEATGGAVLGGVDLGTFDMFTYDFARQLQAEPGPFKGVASYDSTLHSVNVRIGQFAEPLPGTQVSAALVSGNYFDVLGAHAMLGRCISSSDETGIGRNPVVVLSARYWQQRFSSDRQILGETIAVNGTSFAVIGVMPAQFHGLKQALDPPDLWVPLTMQPQITLRPSMLAPRSFYILHMFARLESPSSLHLAQQWLNQQIHTYVRAGEGASIPPDRRREIERISVRLTPAAHGISELRGQYGSSLQILMAVVVIVLLIACANLANFVLARSATRQHEIATRLALGSARSRIVCQGLAEAMLLSLAGGLLGLALAFVATRALITFVAQDTQYTVLSAAPDGTILVFTLLVSLATGALFGLMPALSAAKLTVSSALTSNARTQGSSGDRSSRFWPRCLVVVQVVFSLLLLVCGGLFLRTLHNLQNQNYGFERTHLLLAEFDAKLAGYGARQVAALHERLLTRLTALPGVRSASLSGTAPISAGSWSAPLSITGYVPHPRENMSSTLNRVSGQYFESVGIRMAAGRAINSADTVNSLKVAVINQTLARQFFPKGDAIGRTLSIQIDSVAGPWQIVGIASDTKSGNPRDGRTEPITYIPLAQIMPTVKGSSGPEENEDCYAHIIELRTAGDPAQVSSELRSALAAIDPNLSLLHVQTIQEHIDGFMMNQMLLSRLTGMFALLAVLLAGIGLYGVMNYSVIRRTAEIGIRLALGAETPGILWTVFREALWLLTVGVAVGLPLTVATASIIRQQLFGLSALDPIAFAAALAVVTGMIFFSTWLPARRATRIDPMAALRSDA